MTPLHQTHSSFVVRIWREQTNPTTDSQALWRGWVQHPRSGQSAYVQDLEELLSFIQRWTGRLSGPDEPAARLK